MKALIEGALARSRVSMMFFLLLILLGISATLRIPKESAPDVQIPIMYVTVTLEGISPEDSERLIIRPLEKELRSIEGIKKMTAYASQGRANIVLEFYAGFDSEKALSDVREKIDIAKPELPEDADEPQVQEVNFSLFPVVNVILTAQVPELALNRIARDLRDRIEEVSSVLNVEIAGAREETVDVVIDPVKIRSYGIDTQTVAFVTRYNQLVAAGTLLSPHGGYSVKVPGLIENIQDIYTLPVKVSGEAVVTLADIGSIRKSFKDPTSFARVNGQPALVLEVSKRTGENLLETVERVKEVVAETQKSWPGGIQVLYSQDQSNQIKMMFNDLLNNLIFAIILVMLLVVVYMGWQSSFYIALAIPCSFFIGILAIEALGLTMNIVVLFSLIMASGMLVDNGIVVTEMADRKIMSGMPSRDAFGYAANRMAWPVISSTLTTLIAFAPLLFWPGVVGQFMKYLPLTLIATLTASLAVALIFIPVLSRVLGYTPRFNRDYIDKLIRIEEGRDLHRIGGGLGWYVIKLDSVLKRPGRFVLIIVGALFASFILFGMFSKGVEFFPDIEPDNAQVQIRARGNLSIYEQDEILRQVENRILDMWKEVRVFYARSGSLGAQNPDMPKDVIGVVQLEFQEWYLRRNADKILEEIRNRTADIGGIVVEPRKQESGPPVGKPIQIELTSYNTEKLVPALKNVLAAMEQIGGFADQEDNLPLPAIEWELALDRVKAARFNIDISTLGSFVRLVTNGLIATEYRPDDTDEEVDVVLRFPPESRNLATLDTLFVNTSEGSVPISSFIKRVAKQEVGTIERRNGKRMLYVKADVQKGILPDNKVHELRQWYDTQIKEGKWDADVALNFAGEDEEQKETANFLQYAFIIALLCMVLLLTLQFNSLFDVFVIMTAIVLSTTGVLLGLLVTGQAFGIVMCGIAVIALGGIVVNNNIIFIDTYRTLRAEGVAPIDALLRTGTQRMRPILLTAATTVLGLIPMVFALTLDFINRDISLGAPSTQWWRQLSAAIAGGLTFATILTLFFTPCLLLLGERWMKKKN